MNQPPRRKNQGVISPLKNYSAEKVNSSKCRLWWLVVAVVLVVIVVGVGLWLWGELSVSGRTGVAVEDKPLRLHLRNGFEVYLPANALPTGSRVRVVYLSPDDAPQLPKEFERAVELYEVTADTPLAAPAILRLPLPDPGLEEVYQLHHYRDGQWQPLSFEIQKGFAVAHVESFSYFAWLEMKIVAFNDWADEMLMTYLNPDTYISWYRGVTGAGKLLTISLEETSSEILYDKSASLGLIEASAQLINNEQVRLRVRNGTQIYLQVFWDASAPVMPKRGNYFDPVEAVRLATRFSVLPWGGTAWTRYVLPT